MSTMATERAGDLVIPQGAYAFVQDGATGQVDVIVGPTKISLAETDRPVKYDHATRTYTKVTNAEAITPVITASEGQYLVLTNPAADGRHPADKGKQPANQLTIGKKLNISGPKSFPLYPGQFCEVVDGHQLKYNEYLIIRIYDEEEAKKNWGNSKACVKVIEKQPAPTATNQTPKKEAQYVKPEDIQLGTLFIVRGVDTSFFIPPTGVEVLKEAHTYVRQAVTLETLEYCVLLDQNGEKRYVKGPEVVFPNPTETFVANSTTGVKKHQALELNENMGLYVKVIQDYKEGNKEHKSGDELFLTGKDTKIYYPRAEHAIVKYGDQLMHYATALPAGEGRYVLNKETGKVEIAKGPKMLLPNPIKEVIVRRVLNEKTVDLWFPGNTEAKKVNLALEAELTAQTDAGLGDQFLSYSMRSFAGGDSRVKARSALYAAEDTLERKTSFSKPRTITLDNKYEGVVMLNVWPGFAVQTISKTGERKVVKGPSIIMLEYDETLEVLELSTGKPKSDGTLFRTAYLQTQNNVVSDIIEAVTSDQVNVSTRLSYRVNFKEGQEKNWFSVSNYVKLLTQHLRSVVRNSIKKVTIEEFNEKSTDIIRDIILGQQAEDGKRPGKSFEENGMVVYDVEVLNVQINDKTVSDLLLSTQHKIVENKLNLKRKESTTNFEIASEKKDQELLAAKDETNKLKAGYVIAEIKRKIEEETQNTEARTKEQSNKDIVHSSELARTTSTNKQQNDNEKAKAEVRIKEAKEKLAAIQPGLIEALIGLSGLGLAETLAKNIKQQTGGLATLFGGDGGFDGLIAAVKGTPLEEKLNDIIAQWTKQRTDRRTPTTGATV